MNSPSKDKHEIVQEIFIYLLSHHFKKYPSTGELRRAVYDLYYRLSDEKPIGECCLYCGRDEDKIDKDGYGPCGCV